MPETDKVCTVVNVMNKDVREGNCPFYKSDEKITMKRGFTHLFDDMPKRIGTAIRLELDEAYGHTTYYKYRNFSVRLQSLVDSDSVRIDDIVSFGARR